jgi:DNA polymerase-3 subunit epsilon
MHPQVRAHALDEWLEHFGIECLARHEAVADTLATAELWLLLWPALQRAGVRGSAAAQALARNQRWLQR